jgi:hypothetical protein
MLALLAVLACACGSPAIVYISDPLYERIDEGRFAQSLARASSERGYSLRRLAPARDESAILDAVSLSDTRLFVLSPLAASFAQSLRAARPGSLVAVADAAGLGEPGVGAFYVLSEPIQAIERAGRFMRAYLEEMDARGEAQSLAATLIAGSGQDASAREESVRRAFEGFDQDRLRQFRYDSKEALRLASAELKELDIAIALVDARSDTRSALDALPEYGVFLCVVCQSAMPPERRGIGLLIEPDRDAQASEAVSALLEGRAGSVRVPMLLRLSDWGRARAAAIFDKALKALF